MSRVRALGSFVSVLAGFALVPAACTSSTSNVGSNLDGGGTSLEGSSDDATNTSADGGLNADAADATPPPPAAGGTGAFGIITVNGKQKLYLPQTTSPLANFHAAVTVVDVGVAGNGVLGAPALITNVDLGDLDFATASGGDATVVIAVSTNNPKIHFIDPQTDTLVKTIELPASFGQSSFSGGGGYVTGVAVDSTNHRAILSVYDGFQLVDLTTMTLGAHIQAAPSENFGFDSVRGRIIAPFYDCSSSSGGDGGALTFCNDYKNGADVLTSSVNVIDLSDNTVYTYVDGASLTPTEPLGSELDSAAVDPTTGVAVVPSEGNGYQNVIDLAQATFNKASKTFTAPVKKVDGFGYEGVSIAPAGHHALWESEGSSSIAVADLTQLGKVVMAEMPQLPDTFSWSNMGDPHGVAVATGILDGKPAGFLVSYDRKWVARINLQGLLGNVTSPEGGMPDGGTATGFVTYLDATK